MTEFYASSEKDYWETPWSIIYRIQDMTKREFDTDAASTADNKKAPCRLGDGLIEHWPDDTFCNPPYGRGVYEKWLYKALETNNRAILLIKANTDSKAFQALLRAPNTQFWFVPGRIKFELNGEPVGCGATFSSCVVFFNYRNELANGDRLIIEGVNV